MKKTENIILLKLIINNEVPNGGILGNDKLNQIFIHNK